MLIAAARLGNDASYKMFLKTALPFIRRNVASQMSRFGHTQLSEDVTQEILIAVHLKLHTYDAAQPFLAWLRAVLKHKVIDALWRQRVDTISMDAEGFSELPGYSDTEETTTSKDLRDLLAKLKPPAGDIIYDFKVEGASVKEIAEKYNITESNVKVIVHRGLQKLSSLVAGGKV